MTEVTVLMKGELEELGEEVDENVDSISKIQTHILNLTGGAVNIFDDEGNFRDIYNIMEDIAAIYDDLSDPERADLLETIAGKNRANAVQALINSWDQVAKAKDAALNAEGTAEKEQSIYMDSLKGKLDTLSATWQTFANDFLSSKTTSAAIEGLTKIIDLLDKLVNTIGSIGTVAGAGGLVVLIKNFGALADVIGTITAYGAGAFFAELAAVLAPILPVVLAIAAAIGLVGATIYNLPENRFNRMSNEADKARSSIEDVKNEIEALSEELDNTKSRIAELESKDVLSLTDEAELKRLKEENEQLEIKKKIQENLLKVRSDAAAVAANNVLQAKTFEVNSGEGPRMVQGVYGQQFQMGSYTTANIIEYTKSKYDELQKKQEEYNKLAEEIQSTPIEAQTSEEFESKVKELESYGKELDDLSNIVTENIDKINENYPSLFNDDGTVRKGCEDTVTMVQEFFGSIATSEEELGEKVKQFGDDLKESFSGAIDEINGMSLDQFNKEIDKVVDGSADATDALQQIVDHAIKSNLIEDSSRENVLKLVETLKQLGIISVQTADNMENVADEVAGAYGAMSTAIENATTKASNMQKLISMDDGNKAYQDYSAGIREMADLLEKGATGNGSKLWTLAQTIFGEKFDVSKVVNEKDLNSLIKDLEKMVNLREKFVLGKDDDAYNTEGLQKWMDYINESERIQKALKETKSKFQQEDDGTWTIDIDSSKLDDLQKKTGITQDEWALLLQEISQFAHVRWADNLIKDLDKTKNKAGELVYTFQDLQEAAKDHGATEEDVISQIASNAGAGAKIRITGDTSGLEKDTIKRIEKFSDTDIKLDVDADTSKAEKKIEEVSDDAPSTLSIDADTSKAESKIDKATQDKEASLEVDADVDGEGQLNDLQGGIDSLPDQKTVNVEAKVNGKKLVDALYSSIDKLKSKTVIAAALVNGKKAVDSLKDAISGLKSKTITITTIKKTKKTTKGGDGDSEVNGTAHISGSAHTSGNWGTKKAGKALVGELGRKYFATAYSDMRMTKFI